MNHPVIWRPQQKVGPTLVWWVWPMSSPGQVGGSWAKKGGGTWEVSRGFPGGPLVKNPPCNPGNRGSIPGQGIEIPHVSEHLSPNATTAEALEPQPDSVPTTEEPASHTQSRVPQPSPDAASWTSIKQESSVYAWASRPHLWDFLHCKHWVGRSPGLPILKSKTKSTSLVNHKWFGTIYNLT